MQPQGKAPRTGPGTSYFTADQPTVIQGQANVLIKAKRQHKVKAVKNSSPTPYIAQRAPSRYVRELNSVVSTNIRHVVRAVYGCIAPVPSNALTRAGIRGDWQGKAGRQIDRHKETASDLQSRPQTS
eukprot:jgi/Chrzof1/3790/Cz13g08250.t1